MSSAAVTPISCCPTGPTPQSKWVKVLGEWNEWILLEGMTFTTLSPEKKRRSGEPKENRRLDCLEFLAYRVNMTRHVSTSADVCLFV